MATIPTNPGCRSCVHWKSDQHMTPHGYCRIHDCMTRISDSCSSHDGMHEHGDMAGMVLTERECIKCESVTVYSAYSGGQGFCPRCD